MSGSDPGTEKAGRGLIYLASPYSDPDPNVEQARFDAVCSAASEFMRQGRHIFSPIAHTHPIAHAGGLPRDFTFWREYDEAIIAMCSELWVLQIDGWDKSHGIEAEIDIANKAGIPIRFLPPATTVAEEAEMDEWMNTQIGPMVGEVRDWSAASQDPEARQLHRRAAQARMQLRQMCESNPYLVISELEHVVRRLAAAPVEAERDLLTASLGFAWGEVSRYQAQCNRMAEVLREIRHELDFNGDLGHVFALEIIERALAATSQDEEESEADQ